MKASLSKIISVTMSLVVCFVASFAASDALADGFVCFSPEEQLQIQVYNNTAPEAGTRSPSVMIVSDLAMPFGEQLIAKFSHKKGELHADGARYFARARPMSQVSESEVSPNWDDELDVSPQLLGYSVASLLELSLAIDFNYESPVARGTQLQGVLELVGQNGDVEWFEMDCIRYLR